MLHSTIDLEVNHVFSDHTLPRRGRLFVFRVIPDNRNNHFLKQGCAATERFRCKRLRRVRNPNAERHAGGEFYSYLRDVYVSVKKRWFANMPPSVEKGQQGTNTFEFHVLQDGSVPKDSLKMVLRSDKSDFDAASLQGIREAVPFSHLPEKLAQPFIVLRFTFYYNLPIPRS